MPVNTTAPLVEVCVDSVGSAVAAEGAGAGRVELCANLVEGGTTPSAGMIAVACEHLRIPVFVIIRPRGGDFLYSESDIEVMRRDVQQARALGARGVVLGLLRADGSVDVERTRMFVAEAHPMEVTFHRAFDVTPDAPAALEALIALGVERVLTSGQSGSALEGRSTIAALVRQAAGRIGIVPGGGINEDNVEQVLTATRAREVHVRLASVRASPMQHHNPGVDFGGRSAPSDRVRMVTCAERVARVVQLTSRDADTAGAA